MYLILRQTYKVKRILWERIVKNIPQIVALKSCSFSFSRIKHLKKKKKTHKLNYHQPEKKLRIHLDGDGKT